MKPEDEDDEVIKEVRRVRERLFQAAGGSLEGLYKSLKNLEAQEAVPVVNLPPRRPSPSNAKAP